MENPLAPHVARRAGFGKYHVGYILLAYIGLAAMVACAVIAAPLILAPVQAVVSSQTVSKYLEGAQFLSDEKGHSTVYVQDGISFAKRYSDSYIMSADFGPTSDARIARVPEDGSYELRDGGKVIYRSSAALDGVDRSSDGKYIVYAEQATTSQPALANLVMPNLPLSPNEWAVWTVDIASGATVRIGTGLRPFFIDDTHVARIAPVGIIVTDIVTGEERRTLAQTFAYVPSMPIVSPDRTLVGIANPTNTSIRIYRTLPDSTEEVATLSTPDRASSYALDDDGLYSIRLTSSGSELWLQPFAAGSTESRVLTFPGWLRITRVLLNA